MDKVLCQPGPDGIGKDVRMTVKIMSVSVRNDEICLLILLCGRNRNFSRDPFIGIAVHKENRPRIGGGLFRIDRLGFSKVSAA